MAEIPHRLQTGTDFEQSKPIINEAFAAIDGENRTKIIKNGNTPKLLMGYQKDGFGTGVDYGLKIAKEGYDVTTATDAQMAFNSAFNTFKVVQMGTLRTTIGSDAVTLTAAHGLGYTPAIIAYVEVDYANADTGLLAGSRAPTGTHLQVPHFEFDGSTFGCVAYVQVNVDSTNVKARVFSYHPDTDGTYTITYYLLQETAN